MTLSQVHANLATAMLLFLAAAGLWGLATYFLNRAISGNYWGILAVGEILIAAQFVLGVVLWLQGLRPARGIHLLYGVVALIGLPAYYAYTKGRDDRQAALAYGLLCLFLLGITLRASQTAALVTLAP